MSGRVHVGLSGPTPRPGTRFRVIGPKTVNGMNVWTVHEVVGARNGYAVLSEAIGPPCFTRQEAVGRAEDLDKGKKLLFMGMHRFERKMVDS